MGTDPARPPYRVPTLAEIRALTPNGLTVASTFAGGGGSSTGYRMAGFRVAYAGEFVAAARETYAANMSGSTVLDDRDIRAVTAPDLLDRIGLARGELDVLDGSPPCASFSTAGKRQAKWGRVSPYSDTSQRTDDLFFEFARLVEGVAPKVFVAENVSGLVKGTAKGYFKAILARLTGAGYRVSARLLDAAWLGVPQARQRLIIVGVRDDLGRPPAHPSPLPYSYPLAAALGSSPAAITEDPETGERIDLNGTAVGAVARRLRPGAASEKYFNLIRTHCDRPCPTVTASGGSSRGTASVIYPDGRRKFTIAELRAICGFPPDYVLTGSYAQRWERLGRSVPPLMMRAVAATVAEKILTGGER